MVVINGAPWAYCRSGPLPTGDGAWTGAKTPATRQPEGRLRHELVISAEVLAEGKHIFYFVDWKKSNREKKSKKKSQMGLGLNKCRQ
jgi:hypothetical protein